MPVPGSKIGEFSYHISDQGQEELEFGKLPGIENALLLLALARAGTGFTVRDIRILRRYDLLKLLQSILRLEERGLLSAAPLEEND